MSRHIWSKLETQCPLDGFGRNVKTSPIDQENPPPSRPRHTHQRLSPTLLQKYQFSRDSSPSPSRATVRIVVTFSQTPQTDGPNRVDQCGTGPDLLSWVITGPHPLRHDVASSLSSCSGQANLLTSYLGLGSYRVGEFAPASILVICCRIS